MSEAEYLGPYRIGKVIGRGGMGSVYEATHAKTGEQVAVKLIAQHVADDPRFRRRFDGEVETLRRLKHPGIVRLIGYGEESGRLFYSMEMVEGETLQQRIRDVKRMGWLPTVDLAIQICAALKHAHDIGVVHRDLKPANLLITPANEVKLVDFGIAKLFGYGEQTVAGSILGTADYMAPEQAGDGPITPRTDLYALGSLMYAMMSGRSPFAGKKLTQVMESLKKDQAVPLDLINPEIPPEVVEIVHHLLKKDPKDRPPTALSVMKRLQATRAGLQRSRTVTLKDDHTQGGSTSTSTPKRPTSSGPAASDSTSNSDTKESHLTDHSRASQPGTGFGAKSIQTPSNDSLTIESLVDNGLVTSSSEDMPATQESRSDTSGESQEFSTGATVTPTTSFRNVDADDRETGFLSNTQTSETTSHRWIQAASIACMVAILLGGIYLFVRAIQTPSADAMYSSLEQAADQDELTLNENQLERFTFHYPNDSRVEQVRIWQQQADLDRTIKRLNAQARRAGGIARMEPASQAFLKTMALRPTSSQVAQQRMLAWLDVFSPETENPVLAGPESKASDSTAPETETPLEEVRRRIQQREVEHLAKLTRYEIERLANMDSDEVQSDARLAVLRQRIEAAGSLPTGAQERLLSGLVELYQQDPWAAPIVEQAQAMLEKP